MAGRVRFLGLHPDGALQIRMARRILPAMFRARRRLRPLPLPVRCILALVLVLNGAMWSPWAMAQAKPGAMGHHAEHAQLSTTSHCHHDLASASHKKSRAPVCPCCAGGGNCACGCVTPLSAPIVILLEPPPQAGFSGLFIVPKLPPSPRGPLLRPPIV